MATEIRRVTATRAQERRRQIAFRFDRHPYYFPAWFERALCILVGFGHTPIHSWPFGGAHCAWCDAKVPADAPDTLPRDYIASGHDTEGGAS